MTWGCFIEKGGTPKRVGTFGFQLSFDLIWQEPSSLGGRVEQGAQNSLALSAERPGGRPPLLPNCIAHSLCFASANQRRLVDSS